MHPASPHNQEAWKETGTRQWWVGRKAAGPPKGPGKGRAGGERQSCGLSWSEPSPTAALTELHSPLKFRLLHLQIVLDAYMLFPSPPSAFSHDSFSKGCFCCPGRVAGSPSRSVFPHLTAPAEPWLCQLYLHTRGSLRHLAKRTGGIRILACNSFHNTETRAFLYKLYPPLYSGYFSPCILCFADEKINMGQLR